MIKMPEAAGRHRPPDSKMFQNNERIVAWGRQPLLLLLVSHGKNEIDIMDADVPVVEVPVEMAFLKILLARIAVEKRA